MLEKQYAGAGDPRSPGGDIVGVGIGAKGTAVMGKSVTQLVSTSIHPHHPRHGGRTGGSGHKMTDLVLGLT